MTHRPLNRLRRYTGLLLILLVAGCGTISSNTVQLSVELTNRIKDIEASHRGFVNAYFDSEIQRVERFMEEKWTPLFLRNFLGTSNVLADVQKIAVVSKSAQMELAEAAKLYLTDPKEAEKMVKELTAELEKGRANDAGIIDKIVKKYVPEEQVLAANTHLVSLLQLDTPARKIMEFADSANRQIRTRRESLIAPIEQGRKRALDELAAAYQDFYAGQGVITGRLEAAARRGAEEAKLVDSVAGEGTAAKLMARLNSFAADFNTAFLRLDKYAERYNIDKTAADGGAAQIIDTFKKELDDALGKYKLK